MRDQKILVTGPTGNIGLPLVRHLAVDNKVWGLARFSDAAVRAELEDLGVRCVAKDIASDDLDDLPDDFDRVFHAGALVAMASEEDMARTFEVNVRGTGRLMQWCRNVETFVFCSTGGVYRHRPRPTRETDEYGSPIPAYSLSKIAAEQLVLFLADLWQVPTVILRIGAVYGPDGGGPAVRLDRMVRGKSVWVNPVEPRGVSLMWEDDAVRLATRALEVGAVPAEIVNFCGDERVSIEEYCTFAGDLVGIEPHFHFTDETYPANAMDTTHMHELLGRCETSWQTGFRRLVENRYPDLVAVPAHPSGPGPD